MTQRDRYFVCGIYDGESFTPVDLRPKTLDEAKRAKRWQGPEWRGHVCTPSEKHGVFQSHEMLMLELPARQGGWTDEAWADFIARTWPKAEG